MDRLAPEFICAMGMPPVDFVALASGLGIRPIGIAPSPAMRALRYELV